MVSRRSLTNTNSCLIFTHRNTHHGDMAGWYQGGHLLILILVSYSPTGTRITVTWRDGIKEVDIDDGAVGMFVYNISSYVTTLPAYNFMMVRYGTNVSELINNQPLFEVAPSQTCSPVLLGVTSSGKFLIIVHHLLSFHGFF